MAARLVKFEEWESPEKSIYFLRPVGQRSPIKIGCSHVGWTRLVEFTRWSPVPLEIVGMSVGGHAIERRLHAMFSGSRSHLEWFHATPELEALIEEVRSGRPIKEILEVKGAA